MKHAYVKLEKDGTISMRWWVDGANGVATRELIHLQAGQVAFDVPFDEWLKRVGCFVDIDEVRRTTVRRPIDN